MTKFRTLKGVPDNSTVLSSVEKAKFSLKLFPPPQSQDSDVCISFYSRPSPALAPIRNERIKITLRSTRTMIFTAQARRSHTTVVIMLLTWVLDRAKFWPWIPLRFSWCLLPFCLGRNFAHGKFFALNITVQSGAKFEENCHSSRR